MAAIRKNKDRIIEDALMGGLLGAALGALLTGRSKDSMAAALLGAAIGASVKAMNEAKENNLRVVIEENGKLYRLNPDGSRKYLRRIAKTSTHIPDSFTIE